MKKLKIIFLFTLIIMFGVQNKCYASTDISSETEIDISNATTVKPIGVSVSGEVYIKFELFYTATGDNPTIILKSPSGIEYKKDFSNDVTTIAIKSGISIENFSNIEFKTIYLITKEEGQWEITVSFNDSISEIIMVCADLSENWAEYEFDYRTEVTKVLFWGLNVDSASITSGDFLNILSAESSANGIKYSETNEFPYLKMLLLLGGFAIAIIIIIIIGKKNHENKVLREIIITELEKEDDDDILQNNSKPSIDSSQNNTNAENVDNKSEIAEEKPLETQENKSISQTEEAPKKETILNFVDLDEEKKKFLNDDYILELIEAESLPLLAENEESTLETSETKLANEDTINIEETASNEFLEVNEKEETKEVLVPEDAEQIETTQQNEEVEKTSETEENIKNIIVAQPQNIIVRVKPVIDKNNKPSWLK